MRKFGIVMLVIICVLIILLPIYFGSTPVGKAQWKAQWNTWFHAVQKADDDTDYKTLKKIGFYSC